MRIQEHPAQRNVPATLGEGNTPLVSAVAQNVPSGGELFFKLENCNPTGSYKDRFVAAQVTHMLQVGDTACMATSSGNTGSALAAYCARYQLRCVILVNQDAPGGKLAQMQAHGARVLRVPQFVSNAQVTAAVFSLLQELSASLHVPLVVSAYRYCPEGMQGVEAIAHELASIAPDHVFIPVGGGGLYSAVVKGFCAAGGKMPRIHAVQPEGCQTVVSAFLNGSRRIEEVESRTRISGLSVPADIDASRALELLLRCGGSGIAVSDAEVFTAQGILMEQEGIYAEPAGATAFAGWRRAVKAGKVRENERSVCLVTGHGFKDPASVESVAARHQAVTAPLECLRETVCQLLK